MSDKKKGLIQHNKEDAKRQVKALKQEQQTDSFINLLNQAEKIAETVAQSKTFGAAFRDQDGNINQGDIVSAILLGGELGIKPMAAITLGRRLNADSYLKVMKGRSLGLDPMSAMSLVSIINTKNGDVLHTGVHTVAKVLLDAGVKFKFIKDFEPVYKFYSATDGKTEIDSERHKDRIFVVDKFTRTQDVAEAQENNMILAIRRLYTRETSINFKRDGFEDVNITYTLQDATDAGLYKGISTDGEEVEGKANWNNHPATMLRNRPLTIGGRIIAADKLQGVYSNEEVSEFTEYEILDDDVEDVKSANFDTQEEQNAEQKTQED